MGENGRNQCVGEEVLRMQSITIISPTLQNTLSAEMRSEN